jgi:hypothetical protein
MRINLDAIHPDLKKGRKPAFSGILKALLREEAAGELVARHGKITEKLAIKQEKK